MERDARNSAPRRSAIGAEFQKVTFRSRLVTFDHVDRCDILNCHTDQGDQRDIKIIIPVEIRSTGIINNKKFN